MQPEISVWTKVRRIAIRCLQVLFVLLVLGTLPFPLYREYFTPLTQDGAPPTIVYYGYQSWEWLTFVFAALGIWAGNLFLRKPSSFRYFYRAGLVVWTALPMAFIYLNAGVIDPEGIEPLTGMLISFPAPFVLVTTFVLQAEKAPTQDADKANPSL
jgi:hypothetical protein